MVKNLHSFYMYMYIPRGEMHSQPIFSMPYLLVAKMICFSIFFLFFLKRKTGLLQHSSLHFFVVCKVYL